MESVSQNCAVFKDAEKTVDISTDLTVTLASLNQEKNHKDEQKFHSLEVNGMSEAQQKVIANLRNELHLQRKAYSKKIVQLLRNNMKKQEEIEILRVKLKLTEGNSFLQLQGRNGNLYAYTASTKQQDVPEASALIQVSQTHEDWQRKYSDLRVYCKQKLQSEILKLETAFKKKLHTVASKLKKEMESKVRESSKRERELLKELRRNEKVNRQLLLENMELRRAIKEKNTEMETIEESKKCIILQLGSLRSKMRSLETKLARTGEQLKLVTEKSTKAISLYGQQLFEKKSKLEEQKKTIKTQEEMIIGFCNTDLQDSTHWPKFFKIQAERIARSEKRIVHLEIENDLLHEQLKSLMTGIRNMEEELTSKERMLNEIQNRVPDTVALFRDKEALLRELRSQLNHRDLQLLDYSRELDRMKRINEQLESGLWQASRVTIKPNSGDEESEA